MTSEQLRNQAESMQSGITNLRGRLAELYQQVNEWEKEIARTEGAIIMLNRQAEALEQENQAVAEIADETASEATEAE